MKIRPHLLQARATVLALFVALLRRLLASCGLTLTRLPRALINRPGCELRMSLEYVVAHRMARAADFFFVQIGAFDGQARRRTVGEELLVARPVVLVLRLILHVLPAARGQ